MPLPIVLLMVPPEAAPEVASLHGQVEGAVVSAVLWLKLGAEAMGAAIIVLGVVSASWLFVKSLVRHQTTDFTAIRLALARYLALALEFQLGADILSTVIAPSWEQIGKLGAIAIIRTALNYFLSREMREERREATSGNDIVSRAGGDAAEKAQR